MNKRYVIGGGIVGLAVVVFAVWFFFFKDDAPDAVDVDDANDQLDADLADLAEDSGDDGGADGGDDGGDDCALPTEAPGAADGSGDGIDGRWIVDGDIGDFDFDTASGSFAGFRVAEELTIGETTAVGRSGCIAGAVTIDGGQLTAAEVTVDMTSIVSNDSRRESAIRRAVRASEFPTATFTFAGGVDVSAIEPGGDPRSFTVEGDLTVGGVTNPVTFAIDANVRDDGFGVIVGSTEIVWEDFDITPPSASIVVSVADEGTVEFQLIVAR